MKKLNQKGEIGAAAVCFLIILMVVGGVVYRAYFYDANANTLVIEDGTGGSTIYDFSDFANHTDINDVVNTQYDWSNNGTGSGSVNGTFPYTAQIWVDAGTYYCQTWNGLVTSSSDADALINSAYNAGNGTAVFVHDGTFMLDGSIMLDGDNMGLFGSGKGTILKLEDGANCDVVQIVGNYVKDCTVKDLLIDGSDSTNTAGRGIYILTPYHGWDGCHYIDGVHIKQTDESGIYITNSASIHGDSGSWGNETRVSYISHVNIEYPGEWGIYLSGTDHFLSDIEIGFAGKSGMKIIATSSKFSNIKAFACGQDNIPNDNAGFLIQGVNSGCYNVFADCVAEDGRYNGWLLYNGARDDVFSSCWARNCGRASANVWDGWNVTTSCYRLMFSSCWSYDSVTTQLNGFGFYSSCYQITLASCQATGNGAAGVYFSATDNSTVSSGVFNDNGSWGILQATGTDYVVIIGAVCMFNGATDQTGIQTVGTSSKCNHCYNGTAWVS